MIVIRAATISGRDIEVSFRTKCNPAAIVVFFWLIKSEDDLAGRTICDVRSERVALDPVSSDFGMACRASGRDLVYVEISVCGVAGVKCESEQSLFIAGADK